MQFTSVTVIFAVFVALSEAAFSPKQLWQQRIDNLGKAATKLLLLSSLPIPMHAIARARADTRIDTRIDEEELMRVVNSGRVFVHDDFLSPNEFAELQNDILRAEARGIFSVSGLSNFAASQQMFDKTKDRAVAPVLGGGYTSEPLMKVAKNLGRIRRSLAVRMNRPSMSQELNHEIYYSISPSGAGLQLHLDERHEELKGRKAYLGSSRRSLSWLLYLSDRDWDSAKDGGQLRTFPVHSAYGIGGSHRGNLQVAWLKSNDQLYPVFLDAWREPGPTCALYTVNEEEESRLITREFDLQILAQSRSSIAEAFFDALIPELRRDQLLLLEDPSAWKRGEAPAGSKPEEVSPKGGRLVVFDSTILPHEVEPVAQGARGRRLALAGWWHEELEHKV